MDEGYRKLGSDGTGAQSHKEYFWLKTSCQLEKFALEQKLFKGVCI